jgi:hypothetical protein
VRLKSPKLANAPTVGESVGVDRHDGRADSAARNVTQRSDSVTLRANTPRSEVTPAAAVTQTACACSIHAGASGGPKDICRSTDQYDRVMADEKRAGFIAGGPRRARNDGKGFWAFLRDWIASLFRVDRRM